MTKEEIKRDIIVALLSNPNHTPYITHHIIKTENGIGVSKQSIEPIDESTIAIAKALILLIDSDLDKDCNNTSN